MSRVALASIPALTFYKDELTAARRTAPAQQLSCVGKACSLYTPDAVRCTNLGGTGTDIDWKCEADLPESLRFGRVQVSCEGWERPGDPYVLQGSCGLEYRLVEVPGALRSRKDGTHRPPTRLARWWNGIGMGDLVFGLAWAAILVFILYKLFQSCCSSTSDRRSRPSDNSSSGPTWPHDPPPPYSKRPAESPTRDGYDRGHNDSQSGMNWVTRSLLGGLAAEAYHQARNYGNTREQRDQQYDWERERTGGREAFRDQQQGRDTTAYASARRASPGFSSFEDRGEGSSSGLGSMRRSTGYGGSSVR
ncbi:DUF1183-domain-containing protein [Heliocybe sulcata]|uniref:Store-operated calcium entry-associated regulatory factor n=1 Tax=Heliocybe sulcata TaxID=5364 RepID=A0A5C3N1X3_9AGAM|nr:DUF1183-domain-containing protein [Heliocybe sulcata]